MKMHSIEGFVLGQEHFQFWACDSEAGATWSFTIFFSLLFLYYPLWEI